MPPESKSTVKEILHAEEVRRGSRHVQKYKRQGEVVLAGDFNSRLGIASNPNENIGQDGEDTNKNGAEMLMFLKNNEMTLNDTVRKPGPK